MTRAYVLAVLLVACGSTPPPAPSPSAQAVYAPDGRCLASDGAIAAPGAVMESDDDCNTCTCGPSGWSCTERDCG